MEISTRIELKMMKSWNNKSQVFWKEKAEKGTYNLVCSNNSFFIRKADLKTDMTYTDMFYDK